MFRAIKATLTAAALFVVGIGVGSPAHAAASVTINSSYVASPSTVTDTSVTFTNNAAGPVYLGAPFATGGTGCTANTGSGTCVVPAGGTATFDVNRAFALTGFYTVAYNSSTYIGSSGPSSGGTLNLYVTYSSGGGGGGGSSPSSSASSGPAPVVQQFGMPAAGTCNEAQPEGLNWSGVAGGGWGISWAQWMNGGTGGAVCTRTLVYSTVQAKWIVN